MARNPLMPMPTGRAEAQQSKMGGSSYDNPRENIDPHIKTSVIATKEIASGATVLGDFTISGCSVFNDKGIFSNGSESTPAIAFGDGDSGWYESADDVIRYTIGGSNLMVHDAGSLRGTAAGTFQIGMGVASGTSPVFTFNNDADTGIGKEAQDVMSFIAGGVKAMSIAEGQLGATGTVFQIHNLTSPPTSNPSGGGALYCSGGALYYRGSSGTVTEVGVA